MASCKLASDEGGECRECEPLGYEKELDAGVSN